MPAAIAITTMTAESPAAAPTGLQPEHLAWFSPTFPIGSFAFSHGLEWAIEAGEVATADDLRHWLRDLVTDGGFGNDALLISVSQRAALAATGGDITAVNELALALAGSAGRRLETVSQGNAFRAMIVAAWGGDFAALPTGDIAYPVAVGIATAGRGLGVEPSIASYLHSAVGALVSIAVRLGTVTQPQGQLIIAALLPVVGGVAVQAAGATLDDLGAAVFRADLAAIRHETLDGRLFRT